eukprot:6454329-Pyramimonas_sp.AAC.3
MSPGMKLDMPFPGDQSDGPRDNDSRKLVGAAPASSPPPKKKKGRGSIPNVPETSDDDDKPLIVPANVIEINSDDGTPQGRVRPDPDNWCCRGCSRVYPIDEDICGECWIDSDGVKVESPSRAWEYQMRPLIKLMTHGYLQCHSPSYV